MTRRILNKNKILFFKSKEIHHFFVDKFFIDLSIVEMRL